MKRLTPADNPVMVLPLHFGATFQEVAGAQAETRFCTVGLATLDPGGGSEIDVHPRSEQVFYVLSGAFTLRGPDGSELTALPGEARYVAPGEPHAAVNRGAEKTICLVVTAPPLIS